MNKEDVIKLYKAISTEKTKGNVKFRYTLIKNEGVIKQEIEALIELENDIEKVLEPFTKARNELIKKIGVLDKDKNTYQIPKGDDKRVNEFIEALKPIQEKYKKIIDEHNKKLKEYMDVLKEELGTPLKFTEVKIEDCPQDLATESLEIFMRSKIIK